MEIEYLRSLFNYNPETGKLIWKSRPLSHFKSPPYGRRWNTIYSGVEAGSYTPSGYLRVTINNRVFVHHRVVWAIHYGEWPDGVIDHINHKKDDNRIENLRITTPSGNQRNKPLGRNNTSGCYGVSIIKSRTFKKYYACIRGEQGKTVNLGYYDHLFEAACARKSAEVRLGFHINHGRCLD